MKKETYSKIFLVLCSINITCLLISNILAVKTVNVFGLIFTASNMLFPITYILNDVFTEVYGFNKSRFVIWISFFCNLLMVTVFEIGIYLPADESFKIQNELVDILGSTPRVLFASFMAFLVGNFANAISLSKIKVKTKGKYLAFRTIASTIIGEGLDTLVFVPIVFIGKLDFNNIIKLIIDIYVLKVLVEIVLTPLTYKVIEYIKQKEDIDTFDENLKYRILK